MSERKKQVGSTLSILSLLILAFVSTMPKKGFSLFAAPGHFGRGLQEANALMQGSAVIFEEEKDRAMV